MVIKSVKVNRLFKKIISYATIVDLNKCLMQIKLRINLTCAPISELPSYISLKRSYSKKNLNFSLYSTSHVFFFIPANFQTITFPTNKHSYH